MRLTEAYRPATLAEVVGQPALRPLKAFAKEPYASCWLFEGPPGTGKTSTALALANDIGATDEMAGLRIVCASELNTESARELMRCLRLRPMLGAWQVLVVEELERLHPQTQTYLKVALELELPSHAIVVATSNDATGLQPAMLQRFNRLLFRAGKPFADSAADRLAYAWCQETEGAPLPPVAKNWGWSNGALGGEYSFRAALDAMQTYILNHEGPLDSPAWAQLPPANEGVAA